MTMIRPPYLARVAAGAAVYVLEETRKLPSSAVTLPMTALSQMLQTTMHFQQFMTSLAIRGDQLFGSFSEPKELPEWATFDEDSVTVIDPDPADHAAPGRFALYSMPLTDETPIESAPPAIAPRSTRPSIVSKASSEPEIAQYLDYGALTLAQLRARLRSLSIEDLNALLDYEESTLARAPFLTMLGNRIAAAKAK